MSEDPLDGVRYVELQTTTHFSFLRGASSPEELFSAAALLGHTALGVTDRNTLGGLVRAWDGQKVTGVRSIVGVGRLVILPDTRTGEFALLIGDSWQHQGLGREILTRLLAIGRHEGLRAIVAEILPENRGMQQLCLALGFRLHFDAEEGVTLARLDLAVDESSAR